VNVVNVVNKVNVVYMWKSATFTTYPNESKGLVNVVNVSPGFLLKEAFTLFGAWNGQFSGSPASAGVAVAGVNVRFTGVFRMRRTSHAKQVFSRMRHRDIEEL
jgi:hypothetical protein